jgi:hypothetical protein
MRYSSWWYMSKKGIKTTESQKLTRNFVRAEGMKNFYLMKYQTETENMISSLSLPPATFSVILYVQIFLLI